MTVAADASNEQLYDEAMRLAAASRDYFDGPGVAARAKLRRENQLAVATESLRLTTRLLEIVSALLVRQGGGVEPERMRDRTPVPERLGGPALLVVTAVRDLYLRTFPESLP